MHPFPAWNSFRYWVTVLSPEVQAIRITPSLGLRDALLGSTMTVIDDKSSLTVAEATHSGADSTVTLSAFVEMVDERVPPAPSNASSSGVTKRTGEGLFGPMGSYGSLQDAASRRHKARYNIDRFILHLKFYHLGEIVSAGGVG